MERLAVLYDNLIAQTYDGAFNMSGKYNGLQAKFKELAEENIIFVNCYAHTLNLVLGHTARASLDVEKLFENLQVLYVKVSKSQSIDQRFEDCQEEMQLAIQSLRRINTVRWSAREYCFDMFLKRYESVKLMLERITALPAQPLMQTDGTLQMACETCFLRSNSWQVLYLLFR